MSDNQKDIEPRLLSPEAIEAAARVLFAREEPDLNDWRWSRPNPNTPDAPFEWHGYWIEAARAALTAALAATPSSGDPA